MKKLLLLIALPSLLLADPSAERIKRLEEQVTVLVQEVGQLKAHKQKKEDPHKKAASEIRRDYFANDQHDNFQHLLVEARSEREQNRIEEISREISLGKLYELSKSGAVPDRTIMRVAHESKMAKLLDQALEFKIEAAVTKLKSLEGLLAGQALGFLHGDVATNLAMWRQFQIQKKRSEAEAKYSTEKHARLEALGNIGAMAWGTIHEAQLERDRAILVDKMWEAKVAEQETQYRAALEELKKWEAILNKPSTSPKP